MAKKRRKNRKSHSSTSTGGKRRRHGRRKSKGLGSIISFRTVGNGMGALQGDVLMPLSFGAIVVGLAVSLIRRLMPMNEGSKTGRMVVKFAPILGAGIGVLGGFGYGMVTKRKSDSDYAVATALVTGVALFLQDQIALKSRAGDITAALHGIGAIMPEMAGLGALVLERSAINGLGGITLLENANHGRPDALGHLGGQYGAQLGSMGASTLDMSAFGTPSY